MNLLWTCCLSCGLVTQRGVLSKLAAYFGESGVMHFDLKVNSTEIVNWHGCCVLCRCYICGRVTRGSVYAGYVLRSGNLRRAVTWNAALFLESWFLLCYCVAGALVLGTYMTVCSTVIFCI